MAGLVQLVDNAGKARREVEGLRDATGQIVQNHREVARINGPSRGSSASATIGSGGGGGGGGIVQQTGAPSGDLRHGARPFDSNPFWDARQVAPLLDGLLQGIQSVDGQLRDLRRRGGIRDGSENRAGSR